jgi:hypothetical protein
MTSYVTYFLDSARGVYIPRDFAEIIDPQDWTGIDPQDLQSGIDAKVSESVPSESQESLEPLGIAAE